MLLPAAAPLFALPPEDAPAAAELSFFSLDMLPLAAGALELEDDFSVEVEALPDVLLPELALVSAGFCSVVVLLEALPLADGVDVDGVDALPDALPDVLLPELAAELSAGFCSVVALPDALPLADGVDVDGVDALPDALLPELLWSAGWLVVEPALEPDCCSFFVSCA